MKIRLDKMLSNLGYGTRSQLKKELKSGCVTVNGTVMKNSALIVDTDNDTITFHDEEVEYVQYIYLMMNKPQGVISATEDYYKSKTVIDLIDDYYKHFEPFPVGRLDKDTEGLLILTNNGKMAHNLLSPKKHVKKTYFVKVEGKVTDKDKKAFAQGVRFLDDDYKTMPAKLEIIVSDDISECNITIKEGKFHQVKRMFEAVNKRVIYLKRMSMGPIQLDESVELGDYRELTEKELELLAQYID
ncbi:rRNA pseudouridine synthase [Sedimentibacter sp. zth1]|uniref:pseudouridine synthase n=1 Tax=Sedimentibacter sp. zth1 TaxID=2816908 RepID=UPI001A92142B|nr:pseudouridine synthase [Sedimentibacter sp. zth1]QSX05270.1 rRNA pseudouridine synthase [Sedimentibacter sp. zth1]